MSGMARYQEQKSDKKLNGIWVGFGFDLKVIVSRASWVSTPNAGSDT